MANYLECAAAALSCVQPPSSSWLRRRRIRVVAARHAQRNALRIVQLLAAPLDRVVDREVLLSLRPRLGCDSFLQRGLDVATNTLITLAADPHMKLESVTTNVVSSGGDDMDMSPVNVVLNLDIADPGVAKPLNIVNTLGEHCSTKVATRMPDEDLVYRGGSQLGQEGVCRGIGKKHMAVFPG